MMHKLMSLIFILLAFDVLASGKEVGNGGDAVVCGDKAYLLDYFEAENKYGLDIKFGKDDDDAYSLVWDVINRLGPYRKNYYIHLHQVLGDDILFVNNLADIPDTGEVDLPAGCKLVQLAVNQQVILPGDKSLIVNKSVYDKLSERHKAGLMLHEIIYRESANFYRRCKSKEDRYELCPRVHLNSKKIRKYNAHISSAHFSSYSDKKRYQLHRETEMGLFEFNRLLVNLNTKVVGEKEPFKFEFHPAGTVKKVEGEVFDLLYDKDLLEKLLRRLNYSSEFIYKSIGLYENYKNGRFVFHRGDIVAHFYVNGRIKSVEEKGGVYFKFKKDNRSYGGDKIFFNKKQKVEKILQNNLNTKKYLSFYKYEYRHDVTTFFDNPNYVLQKGKFFLFFNDRNGVTFKKRLPINEKRYIFEKFGKRIIQYCGKELFGEKEICLNQYAIYGYIEEVLNFFKKGQMNTSINLKDLFESYSINKVSKRDLWAVKWGLEYLIKELLENLYELNPKLKNKIKYEFIESKPNANSELTLTVNIKREKL